MTNDRIYVPPIKIQGIKTKIVPLIKKIAILNKDTLWVEPFMGSGVVGFNVDAKNAIFSDINPYIIEFYNKIKNGEITSRIVRGFLEYEGKKLEELDGKHYYYIRDRFNTLRNPLDFLFLNRSCFNGMIRFNKKYRFNVPYCHKPKRFSKSYITKIVNQVIFVEKSLRKNNWVFLCQPFEQTIKDLPKDSFVYCDPPYIGRHVDYYESWSEESEIKLRDNIYRSGAKFMVSTWDHTDYRTNEYIMKIWGDCNKVTRQHFYHIGAKECNRSSVVEALLINYQVIA